MRPSKFIVVAVSAAIALVLTSPATANIPTNIRPLFNITIEMTTLSQIPGGATFNVDITGVDLKSVIGFYIDGFYFDDGPGGPTWWASDLQKRVTSECLQLFGGYGFMREYPISTDYADAAVQTIYAGTNEIMKVIIARKLGLG